MKTQAAADPITWNMVCKNMTPNQALRNKVTQKVRKLDQHLVNFPHDALHLVVAMEKHASKPLHEVHLTLRLPSNVLHCEKSAAEPIPAFDLAVKALLRELKTFKAHLRREHKWRKETLADTLPQPRTLSPEPIDDGAGPQSLEDVIRDLFQAQYPRMLDYVSRQLGQNVQLGRLHRNEIDPRSVVDEVARIALSDPREKPSKLTHQLWFYTLLRKELHRRVEEAVNKHQLESHLEEPEIGEEEDQDQHQLLEADPVVSPETDDSDPDDLPDSSLDTPDHLAARDDLVDLIRHRIHDWPDIEKDVFELHFLEGFESHEIALLHHTKEDRIRTITENIQERLRELLKDEVLRRTAD